MTLLVNKFTSVVIPNYVFVMKYSQILVYYASLHFYDETLSGMIEFGSKKHLVSDNNYNTVTL
jgi:hypothetical protein